MPAITLIGVDWGTSSSPGDVCEAGVRSNYGGSVGDVWAMWETDVGSSWFKEFNISCAWRTVPKGVTGGFGYWSTPIWTNISSSSCHPVKKPGSSKTLWGLNLSQVGIYDGDMSPTGTSVKGELAPNGWSFSNRLHDCIQLQINVNGLYTDSKKDQFGREDCGRAMSSELYILYVPRYTLKGLELTDDGLNVTYSVTDWPRPDDRWALESLKQDYIEMASDATTPYVNWSWIDDTGLIKVPSKALVYVPKGGIDTYVRIRMNADFRGHSGEFGYIEGTVMLSSTDVCNTPVVTVVSATSDALVVRVTDSGDKGNPFDTAWVQLAGYPGGAVSCEPGGTVTIPLPPLGEVLTIQAWGTTGAGASSDVVEASAGPIAFTGQSGIVIAAQDGSVTVHCVFNVKEDWSYEPSMKSVKLSGRERESVFYGVGGSATGSVSCDLIDDHRHGELMYQDDREYAKLPFAGVCIYRNQDGERKLVSVDSVRVSWDKIRFVKTVSLDLREVS